MVYTISTLQRIEGQLVGKDLEARGQTPEEAAQHVARRLHGRRAYALRTTGTPGLSGVFTAYRNLADGAATSVGETFHVY
jgi:hypothetical protein